VTFFAAKHKAFYDKVVIWVRPVLQVSEITAYSAVHLTQHII